MTTKQEKAEIVAMQKRHETELAQIKREYERRLSAALTEATRAKADADRYWQAWQQAVNPQGAPEAGQ